MHLIQDVHLGASRRTHSRALNQISNGIHTVVGRGIKFEQIKTSASLHVLAWGAFTAGLALLQVVAIEGLGKNSCSRGFASATRPREQIGVTFGVSVDCVA
ncbi:unannotated protein [freshwater metagenome]|uniref:Unannotated protein n=1 Tax=freshwater metagenome TaxID=449393 RepID=A0A6J6ZZ27_9ZZZZ